MVGRILQRLGFALTTSTALMAQPAPAAQPQRIVAVGDLHGDYAAWRAIALKARLIDRRERWAGGSTILVQTGDIVDRGPDSLKIIRNLRKLQSEAPRAGGQVVVLVGNHEAMTMLGDLRYVDPGEFAAFSNANSARLRERVYETNKVRIAASFRARSPTLTDQAVHDAWIAQNPLGKLEHQAAWSPTDTPDSILNDQFGPLWYRGLITRTSDPTAPGSSPKPSPAAPAPAYPSIDDELAIALRSTGTSRMVIAHTPILSGIEISHGGRLVRIDTGISRFYGGKLSYLEILGDRLVPHDFDRSPTVAR